MPIIVSLPKSYVKTIDAVPYQDGTLVYNGSAQTPTWIGYDSSQMTKTETAQTDAGTIYSTVFTPKSGYQWPDKTKTAKTVYWEIQKATPVVTAPTAKSLTYTGSAQALVNAGSTTGGTLQYSSNNSSWSTSIPTGTNATSYTVYYRVVGGTNYNDVASQSVSVSIAKATPTVTAPTAKSLTYNGSAQTLANAGSTTGGTLQYSSNNSSWSTTIPTGTNATSYTVYYRVVGGTNYNDVASQSISVSIAKANPATPTLSKTSITLNDSTTSTTFTVTRSGDGTVTATSSNTSVATVSVSGTTVTVNSVNNTSGSATITVKVNAGTNYKAYTGTGATCSVTAAFVVGTLQITVSNGTASSVTATKDSTVVSLTYVSSKWTATVGAGTWTITATKDGGYTKTGSIPVSATQTYTLTLTFNDLPDIYTQKSWIVGSSGTQSYLSTGYTVISTNRIQGKFVKPAVKVGYGGYVFRGYSSPSEISITIVTDSNLIRYYSSRNYSSANCTYVQANTTYTYDARSSSIVLNNTTYSGAGGNVTTPGVSLLLYFSTSASYSAIRHYYLSVWNTNDTNKVVNLVPAVLTGGTPGMYDTVRNKFYTASGPISVGE